VDFGEFYAEIAGTMTKCNLFLLRLWCGPRGVWPRPTRARKRSRKATFAPSRRWAGGVPARIRYDNLTRDGAWITRSTSAGNVPRTRRDSETRPPKDSGQRVRPRPVGACHPLRDGARGRVS